MKARLALVALAVCFVQSLPISLAQTAAAGMGVEQEIQAMEEKFFEHDFSKESLTYRVTRLEKFAFGEASDGAMDQRVKRLASVIDLHKALVPPKVAKDEPAQEESPDMDYVDPSDRASYPHITAMEKQILGQTFEAEALPKRLARLETKAFGKVSASPDPASRTDALEDYFEKKFHHAPAGFESQQVASQSYPVEQYSQAPRSVMPRAVVPRTAMANGMPMGVAPAAPYGQSLEPWNPQAVPTTEAPDDPAVFADVPPDVHARMLTRVGWCEEHLYGHTFPEMHLTQRLHQLYAKVFPDKHDQSDMQLMDRLDLIVREVVMLQHPPLISSK